MDGYSRSFALDCHFQKSCARSLSIRGLTLYFGKRGACTLISFKIIVYILQFLSRDTRQALAVGNLYTLLGPILF